MKPVVARAMNPLDGPLIPLPALVVACGALAGDLRRALLAARLDERVQVEYLPSSLHNHPDRIVESLRPLLDKALSEQRDVFVAYADCGTGGLLDALLREYPGVERLPGAHCYEMFAGAQDFTALHEEEPGTFYLTDYLARHFDALVWRGLGLDRYPHLLATYFGNYQRVVYLAQRDDEQLNSAAKDAAQRLGLRFLRVHTGRENLVDALTTFVGA